MPNKRVLSEAMQTKVQRDFCCGSKPYTIIQRYPELTAHRDAVYRFCKKLEYSQKGYPGVDLRRMGPSRKLTEDDIDFIKEFLASRCDYYLDAER